MPAATRPAARTGSFSTRRAALARRGASRRGRRTSPNDGTTGTTPAASNDVFSCIAALGEDGMRLRAPVRGDHGRDHRVGVDTRLVERRRAHHHRVDATRGRACRGGNRRAQRLASGACNQPLAVRPDAARRFRSTRPIRRRRAAAPRRYCRARRCRRVRSRRSGGGWTRTPRDESPRPETASSPVRICRVADDRMPSSRLYRPRWQVSTERPMRLRQSPRRMTGCYDWPRFSSPSSTSESAC